MPSFSLTRRTVVAGLGAVALVAGFSSMARAQYFYEPPPGSAERRAILDAVRPSIEAQMRGPVEFVIDRLNVANGWAFLSAHPQRPGGGQIDPRRTAFANDIGFMDGLQVYALVRFSGGRWSLVEQMVGPTDVAYGYWPELYGVPPYLIGL